MGAGNIKGKTYMNTLKQKEQWVMEMGEQWYQFDSEVDLQLFLCDNM